MTSLRRRWREGTAVTGIWSGLDDPVAIEIIGRAGFDLVAIDLQHGFASLATLPALLGTLHHTPSASIVRVPWNSPDAIMRSLDLGADGVIVPLVDNADEAAQAVSATRYASRGRRSWGPLWGDARRHRPEPEMGDAHATCIVMIETEQGLENLDEILAVEGIGAIYVGPNDLSLSLGLGRVSPGTSTALHSAIADIAARANAAGVPVGFDCTGPEEARHWRELGMDFVFYAKDTVVLSQVSESLAVALEEERIR